MPKKTVSETTLYPVILHQENGAWGYFSPEFGGGGAATQSDALNLAQEMLNACVAQYVEDKQTVPSPSKAEDLNHEEGQVVWLPVVTTNASERIFITLPKNLLDRIDGVTGNRSAFFTELARERLQIYKVRLGCCGKE